MHEDSGIPEPAPQSDWNRSQRAALAASHERTAAREHLVEPSMTQRDRSDREGREHVQGRLHEIFAEPYQAFANDCVERLLHIHIMLHVLVVRPMSRGHLVLRVIHGWENGGFAPEDLKHIDYPLLGFADYQRVCDVFQAARDRQEPLPCNDSSLLVDPVDAAIAKAEANGQRISDETRSTPSRWAEFPGGLSLYTFFKVYNRLVYGEDDAYRSSWLTTAEGPREIHEFHLEEGEFAICIPPGPRTQTENTLMIMHESELSPFAELFELSIPLFE